MTLQLPKIKLVWQYLDSKFIANQPASFKDFLCSNPKFNGDTFRKAMAAWARSKKQDMNAIEWFDGVRLQKDTIAEEIRKYLDNQFILNAPATSGDFQKNHNKIPISTFNSVARLWAKNHAKDAKASKWYNEIRLGRLTRAEVKRRGIQNHKQLIREFLEERFMKNVSAHSEEFCAKHPEVPRPTFYNFAYKWRDEHKWDSTEVRWFNEVRMGTLSPPEAARRGILTQSDLVRQYLDQKFARNEQAKYSELVMQHPEVSVKSYNNTSIQWSKKHSDNPQAVNWYATTRLGGIPTSDLLYKYYDAQFANNEPIDYADFNASYRPVNDNAFLKGGYRWKLQHASDPKAMEWFNNIRLGNYFPHVQQFHDAQYAMHEPALPDDFRIQYGETSDCTFWIGAHRWKDNHACDPAAMKWFKYKRLGRLDQEGAVFRYLEWKYSANTPASFSEAQKLQPSLQYIAYKSIWDRWIQTNSSDVKLNAWVMSSEQVKTRSAKMGMIFEQDVIATLYSQLRARGIQVFYNTAGIAELSKRRVNRVRDGKKVEIRLFTQDLLAPTSGIGLALRKFLQESKMPQLAVDVTLANEYGYKIPKYADKTTAFSVLNPEGIRGQRQLEAHVRVICIAEFLGYQWLNVDITTRKTLLSDLKAVFAAIRSGPESPEWQQLKAKVNQIWSGVKQNLKNDGSQAAYMYRVADDVAGQLRQGIMPTEITAYAEAARAAGYGKHAGQVEGLAQVAIALARVKEVVPRIGERRHPGIDPARWAEAQEFAKAIKEARDADASYEKNKDHHGFDPARLAEAREFARAIQEARQADEAKEKQSIDTACLTKERNCANALHTVQDPYDTYDTQKNQQENIKAVDRQTKKFLPSLGDHNPSENLRAF